MWLAQNKPITFKLTFKSNYNTAVISEVIFWTSWFHPTAEAVIFKELTKHVIDQERASRVYLYSTHKAMKNVLQIN